MSWRTHGFYKGLSRADKAWLKKFDRKWDTKAQGRSREDAFDHMGPEGSLTAVRPKSQRRRPQLHEIPAPPPMPSDPSPELELALVAHEVLRFTVPKQAHGGWSIHLVLRSGEKLRVRFTDQESATRAYEFLRDSFSVLSAA